MQKKEELTLTFTGHSLGGAVAMICTILSLQHCEGKVNMPAIDCITFGAPCIGNDDFQNYVREQGWTNLKVNFINQDDCVPGLLNIQSTLNKLQNSAILCAAVFAFSGAYLYSMFNIFPLIGKSTFGTFAIKYFFEYFFKYSPSGVAVFMNPNATDENELTEYVSNPSTVIAKLGYKSFFSRKDAGDHKMTKYCNELPVCFPICCRNLKNLTRDVDIASNDFANDHSIYADAKLNMQNIIITIHKTSSKSLDNLNVQLDGMSLDKRRNKSGVISAKIGKNSVTSTSRVEISFSTLFGYEPVLLNCAIQDTNDCNHYNTTTLSMLDCSWKRTFYELFISHPLESVSQTHIDDHPICKILVLVSPESLTAVLKNLNEDKRPMLWNFSDKVKIANDSTVNYWSYFSSFFINDQFTRYSKCLEKYEPDYGSDFEREDAIIENDNAPQPFLDMINNLHCIRKEVINMSAIVIIGEDDMQLFKWFGGCNAAANNECGFNMQRVEFENNYLTLLNCDGSENINGLYNNIVNLCAAFSGMDFQKKKIVVFLPRNEYAIFLRKLHSSLHYKDYENIMYVTSAFQDKELDCLKEVIDEQRSSRGTMHVYRSMLDIQRHFLVHFGNRTKNHV